MSLGVLAVAAVAGVWVFVSFFGGGPAVASVFSRVQGYAGVGSGAALPPSSYSSSSPSSASVERLKLLNPTATAARLNVPARAYGST